MTQPASPRRTSIAVGSPQCFLTYHEVTAEQGLYLYSVSAGQFEDHLQVIADENRSSAKIAPRIHVSFDDGHISAYDQALHLLQKHSVLATFFITAGWTDQRKGFMTWSQLREIAGAGHSVQSHGYSHKLLTHCSANELEAELVRSKANLEDKLGIAVDAISAPGGRWDRRTAEATAAAGYQQLYTSDPWTKPLNSNGIAIFGRHMVKRVMDGNSIRALINVGGVTALVERTKFRAKEGIKKALGDGAYQYAWRLLARKSKDESGSEELNDKM